jgi:hypothetical protein
LHANRPILVVKEVGTTINKPPLISRPHTLPAK